jgi:phasin family protein
MSEVETAVAKIDAAAEQAFAEAATKVEKAPVVKKVAALKKPVAKKLAAKKAAAPKKPAVKTAAAKKTAKVAAAPSINPVIKLKDTIMATAKNTDIAGTAKEMLADVQARAKTAATTAYAKTAELAGEAGEFGKANVEAVVESGKIFFAGAQDIVRSDIETGKAVIETATEDAKKVAAVKSPTELFQLQGEIARRNFDALVSFGRVSHKFLDRASLLSLPTRFTRARRKAPARADLVCSGLFFWHSSAPTACTAPC